VGPYSSHPGRTGNGQLRDLLPLLERRGVTAVLSAHDHYYERGLSPQGVTYVISGGAGAPLYDIGEPCAFPHTVAANASVHHYVVVDVDGEAVHLTAKTLDGAVLDETALTSPKQCHAAEPPPPAEAAAAPSGGCSCRLGPASPLPGPVWLGLGWLASASGRRCRRLRPRRPGR
jgi:hypothetical protein